MAWECLYCSKNFVRETTFMNHKCPQMARAEDIKTIQGQTAYAMYCQWMVASKRKPPSIETFSTSRYFNSFLNFVDKCKKLNLPDATKYIAVMVQKNISPMLWCRDECYTFYLEWLDRTSDPVDLATTSINTLYQISEVAEIAIANVYTVMNYREVMQLIRQRRLTPWLLLCSKAFKEFLTNLDGSEREELMNLIGYSYWAEKFEANPTTVDHMKQFNAALGL